MGHCSETVGHCSETVGYWAKQGVTAAMQEVVAASEAGGYFNGNGDTGVGLLKAYE